MTDSARKVMHWARHRMQHKIRRNGTIAGIAP